MQKGAWWRSERTAGERDGDIAKKKAEKKLSSEASRRKRAKSAARWERADEDETDKPALRRHTLTSWRNVFARTMDRRGRRHPLVRLREGVRCFLSTE